MNRWLTVLLGVLIVFNCFLAVVMLRGMEPTPVSLDADIAQLAAEISRADEDAENYGGLIKAQALLRRSVLLQTQAMLDQKKRAWVRGIRLDYQVDGKTYQPASQLIIDSIHKKIAQQEEQLKKAEAEASASGGLIGVLALSGVMADRMTLAMLRQRLIAAEYGIPAVADLTEETPPQSPGKVMNDKDAL